MGEHLPDSPRDDRDPLETELESLRPAPVSAGFAGRVGRELGQASSPPVRLRNAIVLTLAAAACVLVAFAWWGSRQDGIDDALQVAGTRPAEPVDVVRRELPPPTVAAYRRALAESPDALDALLDAHAPRLFPAAGNSPEPDVFHSTRT